MSLQYVVTGDISVSDDNREAGFSVEKGSWGMVGDALPHGWRWATVEQLKHPDSRAIVSGPFGSNIGSRFFVTSGIPLIRGNNLTTNLTRFVDSGFVFITETKASELRNCEALPGDLVFTAAGTLGQVGLIPDDARYPRYIISNKQLRARLNPEIILPLFAFYWLSCPEMVQYIQQRDTGSTIPLINLSVLRQLPIPLPPLSEQRAIARILGSLDDKIALNRRMNRTLEALAAAIFKSWFVDFDPVVARAEGRQPFGMDAETAALFPAAFEESEIGPVPAGWRVGSILEVADLLSGGTPSTSVAGYWDGDVPWVSAKDVSSANGLFVLETERTISAEGIERSATKLLPKLTTVVTARGTVGSYCLLGREMAMNQTNYGLRAKDGVGDYFVFFALAQMVEQLKQHAYGTIFDTITTRTFRDVKIILPDHAVIERFERRASPLMELILMNLQQSLTLAAIRDSLLPKLMSGEVRVGWGFGSRKREDDEGA